MSAALRSVLAAIYLLLLPPSMLNAAEKELQKNGLKATWNDGSE
jgi:hypothetical protein